MDDQPKIAFYLTRLAQDDLVSLGGFVEEQAVACEGESPIPPEHTYLVWLREGLKREDERRTSPKPCEPELLEFPALLTNAELAAAATLSLAMTNATDVSEPCGELLDELCLHAVGHAAGRLATFPDWGDVAAMLLGGD